MLYLYSLPRSGTCRPDRTIWYLQVRKEDSEMELWGGRSRSYRILHIYRFFLPSPPVHPSIHPVINSIPVPIPPQKIMNLCYTTPHHQYQPNAFHVIQFMHPNAMLDSIRLIPIPSVLPCFHPSIPCHKQRFAFLCLPFRPPFHQI